MNTDFFYKNKKASHWAKSLKRVKNVQGIVKEQNRTFSDFDR